jgi:Second Messenger Oligonucleotide or Dinucleotide Synthetase domain
MGGSGGDDRPPRRSPSGFGQLVERAGGGAERGSYDMQVAAVLEEAVSEYSDRDAAAIRRHVETLKEAIESDVGGTVDLLFGGSTQKQTYVNGLSDVDLLARIDDPSLVGRSAQEALRRFAARIRRRLPNTEVTPGRLAVTVRYSDGHELQVLPALSTGSGVRIPSPSGEGWSNVIRPEAFARKLTEVNRNCGSRVVPTIKLFKGAQESLPEAARLSGYHAESLAVQAFEAYAGRRVYKDMLVHLLRSAAEGVRTPIRDRTGQSIHVDDYMGAADSQARQRTSSYIGRLARRLEIADRERRIGEWKKLFGGE